jgi:hypothetical protein
MRYRVNTPAVASQVIGGEAMLIHFDSGRYYAVEGSGADVIAWLEQGLSIDQIISAWDQTGAGRDAIAGTIERFVRSLLDEGLLVALADGPPPAAAGPTARAAFVAPALATYTDLEDLLRLDPIHDVDDAGWPVPKVV